MSLNQLLNALPRDHSNPQRRTRALQGAFMLDPSEMTAFFNTAVAMSSDFDRGDLALLSHLKERLKSMGGFKGLGQYNDPDLMDMPDSGGFLPGGMPPGGGGPGWMPPGGGGPGGMPPGGGGAPWWAPMAGQAIGAIPGMVGAIGAAAGAPGFMPGYGMPGQMPPVYGQPPYGYGVPGQYPMPLPGYQYPTQPGAPGYPYPTQPGAPGYPYPTHQPASSGGGGLLLLAVLGAILLSGKGRDRGRRG